MVLLESNLREHVRILASEIGSRSITQELSLLRAREYVQEQMEGVGLTVRVQHYNARGASTANLAAFFPGWEESGSTVLLGAHYDTVAGTPGADDNASAVAVLIETARLLASGAAGGPRDVIFAAFSTEEPPCFNTEHMGSRVFVRSLPEAGMRIRGAIILEMVGYFRDDPGSQTIPPTLKWFGFPDTGNFIAVCADGPSRSLARSVVRAIEDSGCGLPVESLHVPGKGGHLFPEVRLSDNASFWDAGIPAVMVTDTSFFRNPHYHGPSDTPEKLDYEKMSRLVVGLAHFFRK